jgi:hypothetical protein
MDYWGLSYRSGLEAIARADRDSAIPVFAADQPVGSSNAGALPYADRSRFYFVESVDEAKYFLGTFRFRHEEYPYTNVVHKTEVAGAPILIVAAVHPELSLTPDTVPAVMATRTRNAAATEGLDEAALRGRLQTGVKTWLSRYVRNTDVMELDLSKTSGADLRQGRLTNVRVQLRGGEIGDWRFNPAGVPLETLDVTLDDVIVDLARLDSGELVPCQAGIAHGHRCGDRRGNYQRRAGTADRQSQEPAPAVRARHDARGMVRHAHGRSHPQSVDRARSVEGRVRQSVFQSHRRACGRVAATGQPRSVARGRVLSRHRSRQAQHAPRTRPIEHQPSAAAATYGE